MVQKSWYGLNALIGIVVKTHSIGNATVDSFADLGSSLHELPDAVISHYKFISDRSRIIMDRLVAQDLGQAAHARLLYAAAAPAGVYFRGAVVEVDVVAGVVNNSRTGCTVAASMIGSVLSSSALVLVVTTYV